MNVRSSKSSERQTSNPIRRLMKLLWLLVLAGVTSPAAIQAVTCTSQSAGAWSAVTWDCGTPTTGDDIVIATDVNFDIGVFTANSLTVDPSMTFDLGFNSGSATLTSSTGAVINGTIADTFNDSILQIAGGTLSGGPSQIHSSVIITGNASAAAASSITFNDSFTVNSGVTFTNNGTSRFESGIAGLGSFVGGGAGSTTRLGGGTITVTMLDPSTSGHVVDYVFDNPVVRGDINGNAVTYSTLQIRQPLSSATAMLNGPITVNGTLWIETGNLDDGGFQISAGPSSILQIDAFCRLAIGNSTSATTLSSFGSYLLDPDSVIDYQAIPDQTMNASAPYGSLTINNGRKTFDATSATVANSLDTSFSSAILDLAANSATLTVGGQLRGGGTIDLGSGELRIGGDWCPGSGDCNGPTLSSNTGTVTYNGSVGQILNHEAPYYNLNFANSGTVYLYYFYAYSATPISVGNQLTFQSGSTVDLDGLTFDGGTTATMTMQSFSELRLGDDGSINVSTFPTNFSSIILDPASTITYDAAASQDVASDPLYGNLVVTAKPSAAKGAFADTGGARSGSAGRRRSVSRPGEETAPRIHGSFTKTVVGTSGALGTAGNLTVAASDSPGDVTLDLATNAKSLDVGGDLSGDGQLSFFGTGDSLAVGSDFTHTGSFTAPATTQMTGLTSPGVLRDGSFQTLIISGGSYSLTTVSGFFAPSTQQIASGATLDTGTSSMAIPIVDVSGAWAGTGTLSISNTLMGTGGVIAPPVTVDGSTTSSSGSLTLTSDLSFGSFTELTNSGTLNVDGNIVGGLGGDAFIAGTNSTLLVQGSLDPAIATLDFTTNANLLVFDGAAQTIPADSYSSLQLSGSGTKTAAGNVALSGDLTVDTGVTLDTVTNMFTFAGNGAPGGAEMITGTIVFDSLVLNTSDADATTVDVEIPAGSAVTVNSSLALNDDVLRTTNPLVLGSGVASVSATTGYVDGPISKTLSSGVPFTFPVGAGGVKAPVQFTAAGPMTVNVTAFDGQHPSAPGGSLGMYWMITSSAGTADLIFTYDQADVAGTESELVLARWDGTQWIPQNAFVDTATNTATVDDVTQFSPWTLIPAAACTVVSTADSGAGTLRQAITDANNGTCTTIDFAINGAGLQTIAISSPLILTASNVVIDGFTQSDASANTGAFGTAVDAVHRIKITSASAAVNGLEISGSGNTVRGFHFDGLSDAIRLTGSSNIVEGNLFSGSSRGVEVFGGTANVIGGTAAASRNVFDAMFDDAGGAIWSDGTSSGTQIKGNYIGTDATGTGGSGIDGNAIRVVGATNVLIDQNVVSQSGTVTVAAIRIGGANATISNNRIGTTADGTTALPNGSTFGRVGIYLETGGAATIDSNLISGHDAGGAGSLFASNGTTPLEAGIYIQSAGNTITNNKIGTDLSGAGSIPNRVGVLFDTGATGNVVGGGLGANTIMNNTADGIGAVAGSANKWVDNVISASGGIAVDLDDDGADANDAGDADAGANGKQNYPTVTSAVLASGTLYTTVSLDSSSPNPAAVRIEIVETDANSEINAPLGSVCVAGSVLTNASVNVPAGSVLAGSLVAALATSYSDAGCTTVADGSSEVGASFTVIANTPPTAGNDTATVLEDGGSTSIPVGSNDSDAESGISLVSSTAASNGTANCAGYPNCTYTPNADFNGTDSFTYTIADAQGATATATVTVTVTAVNDAPSFVPGTNVTVAEDSGAYSAPWPTSISAGPANESGQVLTFIATNNNNALFSVQPALSASGTLTFTPAVDANGSATVTVTLKDNGGTANGGIDSSGSSTFLITVTALNDPPVAMADSATTAEDTGVTIDVLGNDSDNEGAVTITSFTQGSNGTVSCTTDCFYTPSVNFNGSDSFTYTISDSAGATATATVTIMVTAVNDNPVANPDSAVTPFNTPVTVAVLANDTDVDGNTLTVTGHGSASNGTVSCTSSDCTYTPNSGFSGSDSFTYMISDGQGGTASSTVTITVTASSTTDLEIIKSGPGLATREQGVSFTIMVKNLGPGPAFNVEVSDPTPFGLTFSSTSGACSTSFPCMLGTMNVGETKTITAVYVVASDAPQSIMNTASVMSSTADPNGANDSSQTTIDICPNAPSNLRPIPNAQAIPVSGTLTWNASGATGYTVYLGPSGTGCTTVLGTTASNSMAFTDLEPGTTYEWRVVASKSGCPQAASLCQSFTTAPESCPTETPEIVSPLPGETLTSPITFMWNGVAGAIGYDVFVDQGVGAVNVASTTGETSATAPLPPGSASWWVEARFEGCPSTSSAMASFTVQGGDCSDETPVLVSPADGAAGLDSPVTFQWLPVAGASSYRVWVESSDSFPVVVGETPSTSLTATVSSGALNWYVQALIPGCPPNISELRSLSVTQQENCPSTGTSLLSPQEGVNLDSPIEFEWAAVSGAVRYAVWASINGDSESIIGTTEGENSTTLVREMEPGTVDWFVEVFFDGCPSIKSSVSSFLVNETIICITEAPQLLLPGDGASNQPGLVNFEWTAIPTAVGYRLWTRSDGVGEFELAASTLAETSIEIPVRGNMIEWYVEALFIGCDATRSPIHSFMTRPPISCDDDASELIAPIGGVTVSENRVNLIWTAVDGADAYNVWVVRNNGAVSRVGLTRGDELSVQVDLEEGAHEWWVTAMFAGCSPVDSAHATFNIDLGIPEECDSDSELLLISPSEGAANVVSPVIFEWTAIPEAIGYQIWVLEGANDTPRPLGGIREETQAVVQTNVGTIRWYVDALRVGCPPMRSAIQHFKVKPGGLECNIPDKPVLFAPQRVASDTMYRLSWDQVPGATVYEVQESTSRVFRGLPVRVVRGTSTSFIHFVESGSEQYFYRVRAIGDCNGERSSYSQVAVVTVEASETGPLASGAVRTRETSVGSETIELNKDAYSQSGIEEFRVVLRSPTSEPETVRVISDQSWMTVEPDVVTLTPQGVTVIVKADMSQLPLGSSSATLRFELVGGGKTTSQTGSASVSVSLVTPVAQSGKNEPLPESLIIPAVAHTDGVNSTWLSDIRLTNVGAVTQKYQLNFTPAGADGTQTGQTTQIDVQAGSTVALNDALENWFGAVGSDASASGMLEIRPLKSTTSSSIGGLAAVSSGGVTSLASSRTYNFTPDGTFGQFIPAIRFEKFVGGETEENEAPRLSLQQISQSDSFRTNLGLVEASGSPVDALVRVFDSSGTELGSFTVSLQAGEHKQLNSVLAEQGITVENGRIEVTAANGEGRLMSYASVVDNVTGDPQLVPAVRLDESTGTKWVLPGVADFETGQASWRTDVRILNAGDDAQTLRLTYYPQNDPDNKREESLTLQSGEIEVLDDLLASFFGETNSGGVIHVETDSSANLVTTGRTYNKEQDGGTFGQFIPAVSASQAIGRGEQALQVLQVEQSDRFRANLGIAEVTGQAAQVEVSVVIPGSKVTPKAVVTIDGNEFTQLVGVLGSLGMTEAYNARISVRVVGGNGRVVAYGSMIDNLTQDPTYVPAQ